MSQISPRSLHGMFKLLQISNLPMIYGLEFFNVVFARIMIDKPVGIGCRHRSSAYVVGIGMSAYPSLGNSLRKWHRCVKMSASGLASNAVRCSKNAVRCSLFCSTQDLLCSQRPVLFAVVFASCCDHILFCSTSRCCFVRCSVCRPIVAFAVLFALHLVVVTR